MHTKRRVGILGGSFDPPTLGHIQLAAEAINLRHVDESWIIPCGTRKDKHVDTPGEHRLAMTQILVESFFGNMFPVKVNDIEIKNENTIPTYALIQKLKELHPDYEFYFILGSDLLENLKKWYCAEQLINEVNFIIFIRIGFKLQEEMLPKKYVIVHTTFVASSSSEIRTRIKAINKYGSIDHAIKADEEAVEKVHRAELTDEVKPEKEFPDKNGNRDEDDEEAPKVVKSYNFEKIQKLKTIDFSEDYDHLDEDRQLVESKYLGIYGIVPNCIIEYIQKHKLYHNV